jgi:hypothetical protein
LSPTLKDRLYAGANSQSPGNALFREAVSRIEALEEHARKLERELALRVDLASENADLRQRKAELERELAAVTQEREMFEAKRKLLLDAAREAALRAAETAAYAVALEGIINNAVDFCCRNEGNLHGMNHVKLVGMLNLALAAKPRGGDKFDPEGCPECEEIKEFLGPDDPTWPKTAPKGMP